MPDTTPPSKTTRVACVNCNGTGQVSFFQGVSRFVITWEECPECAGTGFIDTKKRDDGKETPPAKNQPS